MEREGRAGQRSPLLDHTSEKGIIKHIFPMNLFLQPWKLGQRVYQIMKAGIVQYVSFFIKKKTFSTLLNLDSIIYIKDLCFFQQMIIKALTSVLAVFLEAFDVYCEGDFNWGCG